MSQAHRPTWNPTQGRETKAGSQQIAKLSLAAHTKLKFRQPGQVSKGDVQARDLRAELAAAERAAEDKKRKAKGLPPLPPPPPPVGALRIESAAAPSEDVPKEADGEEEESRKRRKMLQEALEADKDDDESDSEEEGRAAGQGNGQAQDKGKGRAVDDDDDDDDDESEEDSDDDSDDEDETAALMAELAKIKQERAEEKARLDAEAASKNAATRDEEIASGNPLLNLQAALGATPSTPGTPASTAGAGGFAVKRRWDDDLIFKNQSAGEAAGGQAGKGEFVNDLLRSDFHRKFMHKFIK